MYKVNKSKINKILFKRKIKRNELAEGAGISIETFNSWVYRETKATRETAMKVSDFLNIELTELFCEV